MEYIKHIGDPSEFAQKAYQEGYFVEAIQVLHAFLENQARSLLMLVGCVHFSAAQGDTWDIADSFSLHDCLKVLFVLNQISKEEFKAFNAFNSLRNKVVHQIYKEPYDQHHEGIPKKDYDKLFNRTLEEIDFFTRKNEEAIDKKQT
jgi:hypothetical protein